MSYPWNTIKKIIETTEYDRVVAELSSLEYREGLVERRPALTEKTKGYLDFLGKLVAGVSVGVFTIVFNFLLFTWVLHMEASPQGEGTFKKTFENSVTTADHAVAQKNKIEIFEYEDVENSKESNSAFERIAQSIWQAVEWAHEWLKTGAVNFTKSLHSIIDRFRETAGQRASQAAKVGTDVKETGAIASDRRFIILTSKEGIKKEVDRLQQRYDPSGTVYTVQVGAFKDYHRADALRARLIKKGYDAYLNLTRPESDVSIFKVCRVWVGEFTNRKKAKRVSTEIGETEGLQAFVTLKRNN